MTTSLKQSVTASMDADDIELFPFLPYILQDVWEIGSYPEIIIQLIKKHTSASPNLKVLDLGCGKGPVSVNIAKEFGCQCYGIDGITDFVKEAKYKAKEFGVDKFCQFEFADVRTKISTLNSYDIIVLGSIGPVFGDYFTMLSILEKHLLPNGIIIIDDGYIEDSASFFHSVVQKKSDILKQISQAGMHLIDETILNPKKIKETNEFIFSKLEKRCLELIETNPTQMHLFKNYIAKQINENKALEEQIKCSTMVIANMS